MSAYLLNRFFEGAGRGSLLDAVLESTGSIRIEGAAGAGKTRLAREAVAVWRTRGQVVDCFNPALDSVDPEALQKSLRHADIVVVDNVDALSKSSWSVLSNAPSRTRLLLLGAVTKASLLEIEVHALKPLTPVDVEELLAASDVTRAPRWDEADIDEIVRRTDGSLGAVLRIVRSGMEARRRPAVPWRHVGLAFGIAFATVGFAWIGVTPEPEPTNIELAPEFDSPSALRRFEEAGIDDGSVATPPSDVAQIVDTAPEVGQNALEVFDESPVPAVVQEVLRTEVEIAEPPAFRASTPNVPRGAAWLLRRQAEEYTIQLFATSNRPNIEAFLDGQQDRSRFAVFEQVQGGIRIHVVAYGSFASRVEAETAALELPETIGEVAPWIRDFAGIQRAIRSEGGR